MDFSELFPSPSSHLLLAQIPSFKRFLNYSCRSIRLSRTFFRCQVATLQDLADLAELKVSISRNSELI
ncbi:hypothetical protein THRCLA_21341 [Thraustotheca clavata]|uniref:Uncharacterized protein n=1 Tax=Thraustotheca clavata TaxID=74557 RepID=A0A1V9ZXJ4_9STRA|nr:hypothetical protein THRCLA_21341 [Thraustotheca clavata]